MLINQHDADDADEGLDSLREVIQQEVRLARLRNLCSNVNGALDSAIKHVRACSSRRDWRFKRGRARLRYRPVVELLGASRL